MGAETGAVKTFLIADVRGFPTFTNRHGDQAAAELTNRFSELVRREVEERGGAVVEFRGDEALATFDSPRRAIRRLPTYKLRSRRKRSTSQSAFRFRLASVWTSVKRQPLTMDTEETL
jgi:class 3 adenylate cyclase